MMRFFATCPRGLEQLLADDLASYGARAVQTVPGGVAFAGDWAVCYKTNLHSRLATRVLLEVAVGPYRREDDVYRLAYEVDWPRWFSAEQTIRVALTAVKSPLKSLEFVTLRIKDAVCDRFRAEDGRRPSVDTREPDHRIQGFLTEDRCTLYLDTSGAPLYQRGLRQKTVEAPLKENLAAGLLRLSGWQPGTPLLDPMCGSGTLLLEAAQMVRRVAPGLRRSFAFQLLREGDPALWERLRNEARVAELTVSDDAPVLIHGSDSDARAYRAALANLDRAGLLGAVELTEIDALARSAPAAEGVLLCNPPYGVRLSEQEELAAFYPALGDALKRGFAGWNCYLFSGDTRLPKLLGLKASRRTPLFNGALECRLYEFKVVTGFNRRVKPSDDIQMA